MSQWNQGFQHPMQTGFQGGNPQFQQFQPDTQFQQPGQLLQPQGGFGIPTGSSGSVVPQQTGLPVQHGPSFLDVPPHQPNRLLSPSPALGSGLVPQHRTGLVTGGGMLFTDPRLQMMSQTFMPSSLLTPSALPQLQPPPSQNLIQSFQQHNQTQRGTTTQQMSWAPTKAEKKSYDNIFRQWVKGAPFITGPTALEVFGASGLPRDDLARIWTLADVEDRGRLNLAEFHIAMALIYRRLNGMELPEQLPHELIPPSHRDLDDSVDHVKTLLRRETRNHSPSTTDGTVSYLKNRSFNSSTPSFHTSRDATIYKHSDLDQNAIYKPRSRHVDRNAIRSRGDEDNPSADLQDMKRSLGNTARMLDRAAEAQAQRTKEDEELAQELDDLRYRVKRVQEDLDYNSRGPPSISKENERSRLDRHLLSLMHERIPEVERKMKGRDERKEREKRQWARDRDRANDRDRPYSRGEDRPYSRGEDRPYYRGGNDRPRSRGDYGRDRDDGDRMDDDRPRSPQPQAATPVAPAPTRPKPAPSAALASPATPSLSSMPPEQRKAYLNEQARLRVQARMAALGVTTPSPTPPSLDTSVEERLQQEKREAEEKSRAAKKQAEEQERVRRERLESEKVVKDGRVTPPTIPTPMSIGPSPIAATPIAPPTPKAKVPPAPPKSRVRPVVPPPATATPAAIPPVLVRVTAVTTPNASPEPESESEGEELRAREEALRKAREEREKARQERQRKLKELEEKEAAAARLEEEEYQQRMEALKAKPASPPVMSLPRIQTTPPVTAPPAVAKLPTPPPAEVSSNVPVKAVSAMGKSTNPFNRFLKEGASSSSGANEAANTWPMAQEAPPAGSWSPAPSSPLTSYQTAPSSAIDGDDDDWGDVEEKESEADSSDDDDDDDVTQTSAGRADITQKLLGGMVPRPSSTPPPAIASSGAPSPATPPAPSAPPQPPTPAAAAAPPPPPPGDRNALFAAIQGSNASRPTKTMDKRGPLISGKVLLGDSNTAPPTYTHTVDPPPSKKPDNRQPVGWVAVHAAADVGGSPVMVEKLPSTLEVWEEEEDIPDVLGDTAEPTSDLTADIDKSIQHRVRSLYAFEGEGGEDLSFAENQMIIANPSMSGGDWWFGKMVTTGKSGLFPKAYVEPVQPREAKAIYSYAGANPDELTFDEGEMLDIVDTTEEEWWKAERNGAVLLVPAAYVELVEVEGY